MGLLDNIAKGINKGLEYSNKSMEKYNSTYDKYNDRYSDMTNEQLKREIKRATHEKDIFKRTAKLQALKEECERRQ